MFATKNSRYHLAYTTMYRFLGCLLIAILAIPSQNVSYAQKCDVFSYNEVDVKPSFNGDIFLFSKWINENLQYPKELGEVCIQGRVMVGFIVNEDGRVSNVTIKHGLHPALDAEVVRVISLSPKWVPGMKNGIIVKTKILYPVVFQLL